MHELDPKEFARQKRWVTVFLAIALVSGVLALLQAVHVHFDPMAERHYGRLVHVRIADRDFAIPSEYFRGPIPRGKTDNLHLWVMMPDYTPYRGEIAGDRAQIDAGWERHLIVNVDNAATRGGLEVHYDAFRNGPLNVDRPQDVADLYGLHRTLVWKQNSRSPEPFINSDLYFSTTPDGKLINFVRCDRDQTEVVSLCSWHEFQDGQLIFTISYRKSNLPRWHEIQARVQALLNSFSCVPISNVASTKNNKGDKLCPR